MSGKAGRAEQLGVPAPLRNRHLDATAATNLAVITANRQTEDVSNRSLEMSLMNEYLARAQISARLEEAERERRRHRLARAIRARRRAERAAQRAHRLLSLAIAQ